jgi:hypothetical protein
MMLSKLLFWCAVIAAVVGMYSPDGNLCWFIAAHLTMLTIGLSLRRRNRPRATPAAAPKSAAKPA